jgi:hypothetical protein
MLSQKEPGFHNLGNSQPIQVLKGTKIGTYSQEISILERKSAMWLDNILLVFWKKSNYQNIHSHRVFLKDIKLCDSWRPTISMEARNRDGIIQERQV